MSSFLQDGQIPDADCKEEGVEGEALDLLAYWAGQAADTVAGAPHLVADTVTIQVILL
jgi:hypothetical protein